MTNEASVLCRVEIKLRNGCTTHVQATSCTEARAIAKRLGHDTKYARVILREPVAETAAVQ